MKDHLGNKIKRNKRVLISFDSSKTEFTLGKFFVHEFKKSNDKKTVLIKQIFDHPENGAIEYFIEKDPEDLICL